MVLNKCWATFLEAEGILGDEQGGLHSGRNCRDQILSLLSEAKGNAIRFHGLQEGII